MISNWLLSLPILMMHGHANIKHVSVSPFKKKEVISKADKSISNSNPQLINTNTKCLQKRDFPFVRQIAIAYQQPL